MMAGKKVSEKTIDAKTPTATKFPKSLYGADSLKFIPKKPIIVVTLVKKMGTKLIRKLFLTPLFSPHYVANQK
jgi:hypothetical protein